MAKQCFRCGEEIKGFGVGALNRQGRQPAELAERVREAARKVEARGPLREGGDNGPLLASLERVASEGDSFADFWHKMVHGQDPPTAGSPSDQEGVE